MSSTKNKDELIERLKAEYNVATSASESGLVHTSVWHEYQDSLRHKAWRQFFAFAGVVIINGGLASFFLSLSAQAQNQEYGWNSIIIWTLVFGILGGLPLALINHFLVSKVEKDKELKRLLKQHNQAIEVAVSIVEKTYQTK